MFGKKSTHAEPVWGPHMLAVLDRIETRLDRLEALVRSAPASVASPVVIQGASVQGPHHSDVREWLPVLDRFHELVLVAQGHPDLAQQFGLTTRQKEVSPPGETTWTDPERNEPTPEGMVYG